MGQTNITNFAKLLVGIIASGHILIEGVPGLAKTLAVHLLAQAFNIHFQHIQFTPDLLPSDLVGTMIYNPSSLEFEPRHGPIFSNIVLADEINRAPAKVQSALLEAMEEHKVTLGDKTFSLREAFIVFATQNPIEQEGTYALPEAQLDRFMLKIIVDYPSEAEERQIVDRMAGRQTRPVVRPILNADDILNARRDVERIEVKDAVRDYAIRIVRATRQPENAGFPELKEFIRLGASPRASLALIKCAKAYTLFQGKRSFVTPGDVKLIPPDVLRHRIIRSFEAEAQEKTSDDIIDEIIQRIPMP